MKWLYLLLIFASACSQEHSGQNRLRICFNAEPTTLDPRKAGDFASATIISLLYEGLTRCKPGGAVEPALAEKVEISKDQLHYLFYLREAFWSDGKPITADDFEISWKAILTSGSSSAYLLYPILNVEKYVNENAKLEDVGIKAIGARKLEVRLERPTPYFYSLTAFPCFLPIHPEDPTLYSGPFRLAERENPSEIVLVKNRRFWNEKEISLDEVHISIIPDEMTALHSFERGELDWIGGPFSPLPLDAIEQWKDRIQLISSAGTTLCTFNTEKFPFQNLHLRKAFSYAIDRDEIVKQVTQSGQRAATSILPPTFSKRSDCLYDPLLAKTHFEKAIAELQIKPEQLQTLTLYFKPTQVEKRLAQTLQRQWKKVLGITVRLVQLDFKSHAHRLETRDYQLSLASWIAQFDDPICILERFKDRTHLKNYAGWEDIHYASLLEEANQSEGRDQLFSQAEGVIVDQVPVTPIYHWSFPTVRSHRVQAIGTTPCGGILFERFRLEK